MKEGRAVRFTAGTALKNTSSVRLLTSFGFRLTGTENVSFYMDAWISPAKAQSPEPA